MLARVLIVEDEERIAGFVNDVLRSEGFATIVARTGPEGLALGADPAVNLVILDIMLPGLDGLEVLQGLRARRPDLLVLMLTARDDIPSKVGGLGAGADDYLTKPFALEELLARVRALLRRRERSETLSAGGLVLNLQARTVQVGEASVELTGREFLLLEFLMRRPNQTVSRRDLLTHVWQLTFDPQSTVLETTLNRLRRKLTRAGGPSPVETVRGAGYRFSSRG